MNLRLQIYQRKGKARPFTKRQVGATPATAVIQDSATPFLFSETWDGIGSQETQQACPDQGANLTRDDAAEQTKLNGATLWRIETAKVRPHRRTLTILMNRYGVIDSDERAKLFDLAKDADHLGWLQEYEDDLTEQYLTYDPDLIYVDSIAGDVFVEQESEVRRITIYYRPGGAGVAVLPRGLDRLRGRVEGRHAHPLSGRLSYLATTIAGWQSTCSRASR